MLMIWQLLLSSRYRNKDIFIRAIINSKMLLQSVHMFQFLTYLLSQDMEKEIRKQVDDAIAKAKVPLHSDMILQFLPQIVAYHCICSCRYLQESSMPGASELFTNVYKKGFGVEVSCCQICFIQILLTKTNLI